MEAADGVAPLDEATLLTLRHRPQDVRIWGDERGFGLVVGRELSLVVLPQHRGSGLGARLLAQLEVIGVDGPLAAWSHGDHPAAAALAASHGWRRVRELWVMRLGLDRLDQRHGSDRRDALPPLGPAPEGVEVRGFRPGDEDAILGVNAAAFAHHPEQGGLDRDGLSERMREPWFDPEGLIEGWDSATGTLLGFHWTKRHSPQLGEVYVVGIAPEAQGRGLGKHLTLAGLHHLAGGPNAVDEIHLYVEADNEPAVRLYSGLGFAHAQADTHVQYARA